jgi:hypothetical protein
MWETLVNARIVRQLLWFKVCQSFTKDHSLHLIRNGKIWPILEVNTIKTNWQEAKCISQTVFGGICYKWANSPASYTWEESNLNKYKNVMSICAHWRSPCCMSSFSCNISYSCQMVQWQRVSHLTCGGVMNIWAVSSIVWYNEHEGSLMAYCGIVNVRAVT